tara:strand:- start:3612 stop:4064 length:453 start_codon:yes stop_codon:yes gene_type:complete
MRYLADCIVTMLYIGRIPLAPGSWASLAAVILWLNIFNNLNYLLLPIISLILFFIGTYFSHLALKTTNKKDPSFIVVDEWVGQWITFSFLPVNYTIAILGFLLFRFFDISKVGPVKFFEKLPGAWGVMADDIIAGILSMVSLLLIQYYIL